MSQINKLSFKKGFPLKCLTNQSDYSENSLDYSHNYFNLNDSFKFIY